MKGVALLECSYPMVWMVRPARGTVTCRVEAPIDRDALSALLRPYGRVTGAANRVAPPGWTPPMAAWTDPAPSSVWTVHIEATTAAEMRRLCDLSPPPIVEVAS